MCQDGKIEGNFTNHSLRATGATVLFDAGVPESVIQKRTWHKSLEALRTCERVTPSQEKAVSEILSGSNFSGDVKDNSKSSKTANKDVSDAKENDPKPDEDASIFPLSNDDTNFLDNLPSEVYNY